MAVDVQWACDTRSPAGADVTAWASATLATAPTRPTALPAADGEVCVRVVAEVESRRLNRDYRGKDAPTNVLSFPAGVDLPDALVWGDVVVCAPVVAQEADAQGKAYEAHFAHMVVHGVLHLMGYDHRTAEEAAVMERLEIRILGRFGMSDPYGEG
jgi:probable rRNA maturation factor